MKYILLIIITTCIFFVIGSCTTQSVAYRERLEEAKGYALCVCIMHMNKFVDSTSVINKDYSGEYFVQLSQLSLYEIIRIKEYVEKKCMNYWGISKNPEANMIAYSSWRFYNSKELDNFIRKTLGEDSREKNYKPARALGLDISTDEEISNYDTHGGFHGDGTTCIAYHFDDENILEEIRCTSEWKKFPLDNTVQALVYGLSDGTSQIGPFLNDNEGNPIIPKIQNGYYLLIDRQNDAEENILDRSSFNFTLGLYDIDTNKLYYCELDT